MDRYWERFVVIIDEESDASLDSVLDIIASCRNGEIKTETESYEGGTLIYCESPVCGTGRFIEELRRREIQYDYTDKSETFGEFAVILLSSD